MVNFVNKNIYIYPGIVDCFIMYLTISVLQPKSAVTTHKSAINSK